MDPPVTEPAPPPKSRIRWTLHLLILAAFPLAVGILGSHRANAAQPALGHGPANLLHISGVELLGFCLIFGLAWLLSRATVDDLLLRWRHGVWPIPLGIGYSVALRIAIGIALAMISMFLLLTRTVTQEQLQTFLLANRPDVELLVDVSALKQNPLYFWLSVTLVSFVLGGLREELWRAAFLAGMSHSWPRQFQSTPGKISAALVAAAIFGLGHAMQGPVAVLLTGALGFGLGLIMLLHRSIWPAVIAHGMFNATSMALLPWALDALRSLHT